MPTADDEAWTVAAVMVSRCRLSCVFGLIRCAWAAAGICHSQVRHFEGNFNLAGMEFFFACGGLGVVETTRCRTGMRDARTCTTVSESLY